MSKISFQGIHAIMYLFKTGEWYMRLIAEMVHVCYHILVVRLFCESRLDACI